MLVQIKHSHIVTKQQKEGHRCAHIFITPSMPPLYDTRTFVSLVEFHALIISFTCGPYCNNILVLIKFSLLLLGQQCIIFSTSNR